MHTLSHDPTINIRLFNILCISVYDDIKMEKCIKNVSKYIRIEIKILYKYKWNCFLFRYIFLVLQFCVNLQH